MRMIYDDIVEVYIWVDYHDHDLELSPRFDSRKQADDWFKFMKSYFGQASK